MFNAEDYNHLLPKPLSGGCSKQGKYLGVHWDPQKKNWRIYVRGKYLINRFKNEEEGYKFRTWWLAHRRLPSEISVTDPGEYLMTSLELAIALGVKDHHNKLMYAFRNQTDRSPPIGYHPVTRTKVCLLTLDHIKDLSNNSRGDRKEKLFLLQALVSGLDRSLVPDPWGLVMAMSMCEFAVQFKDVITDGSDYCLHYGIENYYAKKTDIPDPEMMAIDESKVELGLHPSQFSGHFQFMAAKLHELKDGWSGPFETRFMLVLNSLIVGFKVTGNVTFSLSTIGSENIVRRLKAIEELVSSGPVHSMFMKHRGLVTDPEHRCFSSSWPKDKPVPRELVRTTPNELRKLLNSMGGKVWGKEMLGEGYLLPVIQSQVVFPEKLLSRLLRRDEDSIAAALKRFHNEDPIKPQSKRGPDELPEALDFKQLRDYIEVTPLEVMGTKIHLVPVIGFAKSTLAPKKFQEPGKEKVSVAEVSGAYFWKLVYQYAKKDADRNGEVTVADSTSQRYYTLRGIIKIWDQMRLPKLMNDIHILDLIGSLTEGL